MTKSSFIKVFLSEYKMIKIVINVKLSRVIENKSSYLHFDAKMINEINFFAVLERSEYRFYLKNVIFFSFFLYFVFYSKKTMDDPNFFLAERKDIHYSKVHEEFEQ